MIRYKKLLSIMCVLCIIQLALVGMKTNVKADGVEKVEITVDLEAKIKITNAEGETLILDEVFGKTLGTMKVLDDKMEYGTPNSYRHLIVKKSDSYIVEQSSKGDNYIGIDYNESDSFACFSTSNICKATVIFHPNPEVRLDGEVQNYNIYTSLGEKSAIYDLSGTLHKPIFIKGNSNELTVTGALGKTFISVDALDGKLITEGTYYLFGEETVLGFNAKKAYVNNAVKLNIKEKKRLDGLYVRPANGNKNMFLTWTRVKKAKSYIVYQKDNKTGAYKKVAIRNGEATNYYTMPITDDNVYAYKVMVKSKKNGKGKKIGKLSYGVKAVPMTNSKSNAESVVANKKTLSLKKGKRKKLKAKITHNAKGLLDKKLRWYSSNKKVARINKNTGKLSAVKKGKCKVWAMAHNGKSSKKITVKVH